MQITKQMILDGLKQGLVRLAPSPFEDGPICQIGDNWFYFCEDISTMSAEEYRNTHSDDVLAEQLLTALNEGIQELDDLEYQYYYWYLTENLENK